MTKKHLISIILFVTILFANALVFATADSLRNAGSAIGNVATDAGSAVKNTVGNAGNALRNGANNIKGAVMDNNDNNNDNNNNNRNTNDINIGLFNNDDNMDNYSATRTNTNGTLMGMDGTTWTWFILAIAAILIVALVWYYASQNHTVTEKSGND